MAGYDFAAIEKKWQAYWEQHQTFRQPNPHEQGFVNRPKLYVLDMFPYPSGAGLHVGHPEGYTASDIVSRYRRAKGFNVLHPMGYDAFGLPAEQYAVEHGVHPRQTTADNIANIERQIRMFGFSYDWSRRLATTDPAYYRWTQWIFLQLYNSWYDPEAGAARPIAELERHLLAGQLLVDSDGGLQPADFLRKIPEISLMSPAVGLLKFQELEPDQQRRLLDEYRLAYQAEVPVNWCPQLGTVLANEEVTNAGRSDRGDFAVYRRPLRQWMLRITAYAERLLEDLEHLDWPEPIKLMQRNWIGKSEGAEVDFPVVVGTTGVPPVSSGSTGVPPVSSGSTGVPPVSSGSTGVPPVTPAFARIASEPEEKRPMLTAPTCQGVNPYPPGEPTHPDLMMHIRNLPHFEIAGATYFASFHCTEPIELGPSERSTVLESMLFWHGKKCHVYAAVVLDNHAHAILRPFGSTSVSELMHSIKSFTSHEINKLRSRGGQVWGEESFDHVIRDNTWFTRFVYYICDNPVKRGLCKTFDQYPWLWVDGQEVQTLDDGQPFGHLSAGRDGSKSIKEWFARRKERGFTVSPEASGEEEDAVEREKEEEHRRDACATIRVYTTRPDTLFGATYMVLAPEHPLVETITTAQQREAVETYVAQAAGKSELERTAEAKEKTGVFTGAYAVNPVNRQRIPIWVADYVMLGYGTGAIMAVPAHDTRDLEFAEKFKLPIVQVVQPPGPTDWRGYVDDGIAINSGQYDGLATAEFKGRITEDLAKAGLGKATVNYKLRDWLFSRQRYWGEPFPIVHCDKCGTRALSERELPLELPEMDDFTPAVSDDPEALPQPPLAKAAEWVNVRCPACGGPARRETNTMPQWAGSCWYYLRYLDPRNDKAFCDPKVEKYWMGSAAVSAVRGQATGETPVLPGVDLYVGGAEHAVLHLLYARFWHKVLFDLGHVSSPEPFHRLFNQGMIRSFAYRDGRGVYVGYEDVDTTGDKPRHKQTGQELTESVEKMSKSLKNVVNPDDVIAQYGADTFRLYEMFMGPLEASKPWNTRDVPGVHRFLHRVWRMLEGGTGFQPVHEGGTGFQPVPEKSTGYKPVPPTDEIEISLHRLIKKVGQDVEGMKFNTAIAAMMEFVNTVHGEGRITVSQAERFVLVLAPFAPHLAEELWQKLGHEQSLAYEPWPAYDPALLVEKTVELAVQVNGKMRGRIVVPADADEEAVLQAALAEPKVAGVLAGKTIIKKIVVPGRLVNIVVK